MGVIVIEGLDYGSMISLTLSEPQMRGSLYFHCIFFFLLDTLPSYWQDLMPILYVARIMVGMFSTDVWHVNNMTLAKFSSALFWSPLQHQIMTTALFVHMPYDSRFRNCMNQASGLALKQQFYNELV